MQNPQITLSFCPETDSETFLQCSILVYAIITVAKLIKQNGYLKNPTLSFLQTDACRIVIKTSQHIAKQMREPL